MARNVVRRNVSGEILVPAVTTGPALEGNQRRPHRSHLNVDATATGAARPTTRFSFLATHQQQAPVRRNMKSIVVLAILIMAGTVWYIVVVPVKQSLSPNGVAVDSSSSSLKRQEQENQKPGQSLPPGFDSMLTRALHHTNQCRSLQDANDFGGFDTRTIMPFHNDSVVALPAFGIVNALQSYFSASKETQPDWPICTMPPLEECYETQLTAVFMAYNPDRLGITMKEIKKMLNPTAFQNLVKEVILVWNGDRHIDESKDGIAMLAYASTEHSALRIVYPLKMGFPNDLMNRYHPNVVQPTTKALLYYDDDGPFYSFEAIQSGFELWKRHSTAQIGAMARQLTYGARQQTEQIDILGASETSGKKSRPADNKFVSHCTNVDDQVSYEFRFFANYDANMVLPSGSMLHANYLCFLWHPALAEIRKFVLGHPVHPDDITVSMIVSQLAGVAPRVYSRRLEKYMPLSSSSSSTAKATKKKKHRRKLLEYTPTKNDEDKTIFVDEHDDDDDQQQLQEDEDPTQMGIIPMSELQRHRSLMFSICWDCGSGMTEAKEYWAQLRAGAVNSLVRYFGSLNSGSIGWCTPDSPYYNAKKDGRCDPSMAKQGWLHWMDPDGSPKQTCP